jgi:5-oxoprolinase (ATP-hydrolysing) subunit A
VTTLFTDDGRVITVDLNCDMGESFGPWRMGDDEAVLPHVTSASVACGFHAGDPVTMDHTVVRVRKHGVALGAHPGLPDLVGFGRRAMPLFQDEAYAMVVYQVGALGAFARARGVRLAHVKPHGALYNMAARDHQLAAAIVEAVRDVDPELVLFGLAGSALVRAGEAAGLQVASEVFADRNYMPDGSLVSRSDDANAYVQTETEAVERAVRMVTEGRVRAIDGADVAVRADTICIHGDGPNAVPFARGLRTALEAAGVHVRAPSGGRA